MSAGGGGRGAGYSSWESLRRSGERLPKHTRATAAMQAKGDDSVVVAGLADGRASNIISLVLAAPAGSEEVEERYLLLGLDLLRAQPLSAGS